MKKLLLAAVAFLALAVSAQAATLSFSTDSLTFLEGETITVDLIVSGLETTDLIAFDLDVAFDDDLLGFAGYTLSTGLGDIDLYEADDFSNGESEYGIINLCETSYLEDFSFQADSFVLATLSFTALADGTTGFSIDYEDLTVDPSAVPLPPAVILMGFGILSLAGVGRKQKAA